MFILEAEKLLVPEVSEVDTMERDVPQSVASPTKDQV